MKNVCQICNKELNFTRVQITKLKYMLLQAKAHRYFVSDEETFLIIHEFHISLEQNQ